MLGFTMKNTKKLKLKLFRNLYILKLFNPYIMEENK